MKPREVVACGWLAMALFSGLGILLFVAMHIMRLL